MKSVSGLGLELMFIKNNKAKVSRPFTVEEFEECPKCARQLTTANYVTEPGEEDEILLICQCGYFKELR